MSKCVGFIFLMTLSLLTVISLLLLSCMQHTALYQRAVGTQEMQHQRFYQLEHGVRQLTQSVYKPPCLIKKEEVNQVLEQLVEHQKSCSFRVGHDHYHYRIEDLGSYPCLLAHQQGTHHFRLSLALIAGDNNRISILQVRVIRRAHTAICAKDARQVHLGISSWRYLANYTNSDARVRDEFI